MAVGQITYIKQPGPGQAVPSRPSTSTVPAGFAWWGLYDKPTAQTGLQPEDIVLNISGTPWQ